MSDKKSDAAKPDEGGKPAGQGEAETGGGGFKAWLPLLFSLLLMPALAFVTAKFLIIPKVVHARETAYEGKDEQGEADNEATADARNGEESGKTKETKGKKKQSVPISKVIVNVAGSMGSRYLMTSFTLVGTHPDFKTVIQENKDQVLDLANGAMASKTIGDLEKPGARNQLRAELISILNHALGGNVVQEIYFTEFAVQ